jgi:uncharacterized protein
MTQERVRFQADGADGPSLEGELWLPDGDGAVGGVVVCHPHPLRGGSMDSNVVYALCQGLNAAGLASLRFNFRGVGRSEGRYGEGVEEVADALGALNFLAEQPGIDPERIGLAGYSFGARVSLSTVPRAPRIRGLLCVAPPLREPLLPESRPSCPFVVFVGDRDGNVAEGIDRYASYLPDPGQLRVVEGTDHFWRGYESILVDAAHEFFTQALRAPGAQVAP